ncbi:MAG: hypothetical protein M0Z82_00180 [Actinomycetota bacterium]|jgi:uncharacterized coiled-coil protein SlyX|nr:hypothetical protein [Actinomycetota bacterium]
MPHTMTRVRERLAQLTASGAVANACAEIAEHRRTLDAVEHQLRLLEERLDRPAA